MIVVAKKYLCCNCSSVGCLKCVQFYNNWFLAELIVCKIIINNNYWKCHLAPQNVIGRENEQRNFCCFKQVDETKSTTVCSLLFFFFGFQNTLPSQDYWVSISF